MVSSSLIDEVVQVLEQHENALRIRKLIYCTCRHQWENNSELLQQTSLKELIEELIDLNSTVDQLSISLYSIVKQLNRKAEYSLLANTIISHVGQIYSKLNDTEATQVVAFTPKSRDSLNKYPVPVKAIIQNFESCEDIMRIRKMLYCIVRGQWENDPAVLLGIDLEELVQEIYNLYPNLDDLSIALYDIVDSLNRKAEYSLIANVIISQLGQLYQVNEESTNIIQETQAQAANTAVQQFIPTTARSLTVSATAATLVENSSSFPAENETSGRIYDPFEVRLAVMKYSNPLRAKIVAFSTLYQRYDSHEKDWSSLRTTDFDELIIKLYETYETLPNLESKLYETANQLDQPSEYLQAANAVVQAIKPFYETH
ncbi:MAG: hypothetical protein SAJ12_04845 [Jaaginema sp. PMC 1079.18]|nr:hypothetical protein [Jaaginema sp. PMC 1080.18]MEC4850320.1 hypothetical protein [Jaaginema sp. PMC 1079.18]MEC4866801.1 hypothetical protein [Jaaginema sp. PMC 1078.18]